MKLTCRKRRLAPPLLAAPKLHASVSQWITRPLDPMTTSSCHSLMQPLLPDDNWWPSSKRQQLSFPSTHLSPSWCIRSSEIVKVFKSNFEFGNKPSLICRMHHTKMESILPLVHLLHVHCFQQFPRLRYRCQWQHLCHDSFCLSCPLPQQSE